MWYHLHFRLLLLSCCLCITPSLRAQQVSEAWTARYEGNADACSVISGGSIVIHAGGNAAREVAPAGVSAVHELSAYPTVVHDQATITFVAEQDGSYELACYDAWGRLVRTLPGGTTQAGWVQQASFRAAGLVDGLYIIRLQAGARSQSVRVLVQR
ncbi:T9SS type A sorting domain-containing protein [Hymenobacter cellulosivorans]|uniref:T9SS type A sorting domain-containing protein n=1 Tax=Hymenobacter cellulosivorans TaxID=2932249 RepID=A0ABY4F674_9BACT|nr:T9SS type A sorting domain-containing protein [Hymenobacter cellulosivorans]UOQ52161.1 T9SS type A sorting domain-containing protein [Hymenobacter cellulosivorans]